MSDFVACSYRYCNAEGPADGDWEIVIPAHDLHFHSWACLAEYAYVRAWPPLSVRPMIDVVKTL